MLRIVLGILLVAALGQASRPFQLDNDLRGLPVHDLEPIPLKASSSSRIRLPITVIPSMYRVNIITILEENPPEGFARFTAPGNVQIDVECPEPTSSIVLHSKGIRFSRENVTVQSNAGTSYPVANLTSDEVTEQVSINLEQPLLCNNQESFYKIRIEFVTPINEGLIGLYQSSYRDNDGNERFLATTQGEATGARQIFPCFDEPALRAHFIIRVGYKQFIENDNRPYHALSNMERFGEPVEIEGMPGYYWQNFEHPRPTMPTYLVAIIVSDYQSVNSIADPTVRTWGQIELMGEDGVPGQFSANAAQKLLEFFSGYFNIPMAEVVPKLDSVAIPDFAFGAMENWGLNTYRVPTLLFVDGDMTQFERWRQAAVVAHEVVHSWYGNYLTIKWWNDLWLKEGFARYFQFHGVAGGVEVEDGDPLPADNFGALDRMVLDTIQVAMENDIGPSTHPLQGESTTEIRDSNSRIIYEKGASLIRMMEGFLNTRNGGIELQLALSRFVASRPYGAAEQDDLFNSIQDVVDEHGLNLNGREVKDIMETWTRQEGFPLVRVNRVASNRIFVSQEKYVSNFGVPSENPAKDAGMWVVPIAFLRGNEENPGNYLPRAWMGADQSLISVIVPTDQWILVNPGAMGYYRVMYDEHFFNLLKDQLELDHAVIPTASRSQLLDDYFNFAFHSYAPITWALDLTEFLDAEETYPVWTTALTHFRKLYNFLRGNANEESEVFEIFQRYIGDQISNVLASPDDHVEPVGWMLKALLLDWGCTLDLDLCATKADALMNTWQSSGVKVPANIQPMVFCAAYRSGPEWQVFIDGKYDNPTADGIGPNQHRLLYSAKGCAPETNSLEALLLETIDPQSRIPEAHRKALIAQIAGRDDGIDATLAFFELNYVNIFLRLGDDAITNAIRSISTYTVSSATESRIQQFHDARESELAPGARTSIRDSIALIQRNREWNAKFSEDIGDWLENFYDQ